MMTKLKIKIRSYFIDKMVNLYFEIKTKYETKELQKLKRNFKFIGKNIEIPTPYFIKNPQYISIGNNFLALHNLRIEAWDSYYSQTFAPKIIIGENVIFQSDCHIGCIDSVIIEDNVLLASRVYISDHIHGSLNFDDLKTPPRLRNLSTKGPVLIKENTWIGEGVSIMPNVTIGKNCVIGANSVVTKNIPDNSIAVGIPIRIIKTGK